MLVNAWRGKGQPAMTIAQFMPWLNLMPQPRRSAKDIEAMMMQWARMHNRAEARKRGRKG